MRDQRTAIDAVVNGTAVPAIGSHLDCAAPGGVVVATVELRVRLDLDDVAGCLWAWMNSGYMTSEELAADDGQAVRDLIVETVVNRGLREMSDARDELTRTPRGVNPVMDVCRDAAERLTTGRPAWAVRLRAARTARGWSQADAVNALQVQARGKVAGRETLLRNWKRWEAGAARPDGFYSPLLARTFDTSPFALALA